MSKQRTAFVKIDETLCKGCSLCISFCPTETLLISEQSNVKGYFPAFQKNPEDCTGCNKCATMCPEIAIEVFVG